MSEGLPSEHIDDEEQGRERVLTKDEVIGALEQHVKNYVVQRELSDDNGIYLLELTVAGEKPGEMTEYTYQRKGKFGGLETTTTGISVAFYEDGIPVGGNTIADYNEITGQWTRLS